MLLTDEEIIGALRLNPNKNYWSEKDWNAQITREIRLVAKAQLKKVLIEGLTHTTKFPSNEGIHWMSDEKFQALLDEVKDV